jgi:hypothetical protein
MVLNRAQHPNDARHQYQHTYKKTKREDYNIFARLPNNFNTRELFKSGRTAQKMIVCKICYQFAILS